jgi:hypothetical protein
MSGARTWTTPPMLQEKLLRRWNRGELLTAHATGAPVTPIELPIAGPAPRELVDRLDDVTRWVTAWQQPTGAGIRVEARTAGGRIAGRNDLPARLIVDTDAALWQFLGVTDEIACFDRLLDLTARSARAAVICEWMRQHPLTVLGCAPQWPALVRTTEWLADTAGSGRHLREIPAPGVDTKFIEEHRTVLAKLLDACGATVCDAYTASQFNYRYGFADKPSLLRIRSLDGTQPLLAGITELVVRRAEIERLPLAPFTEVIIVENEVTYLSLPNRPGTLALFGGGYAVTAIGPIPAWLQHRRVYYWGDLDTHGFAILNRLRSILPDVRSLLMDRETLLAHRGQWVTEPSQVKAHLPGLTAAEAALHQDLVEGTFGDAVRLEQERVSFVLLSHALTVNEQDSR